MNTRGSPPALAQRRSRYQSHQVSINCSIWARSRPRVSPHLKTAVAPSAPTSARIESASSRRSSPAPGSLGRHPPRVIDDENLPGALSGAERGPLLELADRLDPDQEGPARLALGRRRRDQHVIRVDSGPDPPTCGARPRFGPRSASPLPAGEREGEGAEE